MQKFLLENISLISLLTVFLPLLASAIVGLNTKRISDQIAQYITCTSVVISAICSAIIFNYVAVGKHIIHIYLIEWFNIYNLKVNWAIYIDALTSVMLLVVTTVSAVVHIYSVGYMSHDEHKPRFMAYLSLFTFCMLMLVTSDNFLQLFFGWEGVGLCSYLLIGFWFKRGSANAAAIKAFLVNRVGDFGFALGIFTIFIVFEDIQFLSVFSRAPLLKSHHLTLLGLDINAITLICLLLFIGAMGKSAQIGLHTWLPDAMEGPTPVSALIHAATMVTAGVFMVCRCSPLFEYSNTALAVVTIIGAITCIFAASIALVQNDIKKIIAYSTCSQLGYMFFACGLSAYSAAMFHLMTHAFFKALLFLSAGSVIHAMSDEQDITKMGGIWKKIPLTYTMMWIGSLALAGFYPFAGYYSKDVILEAALVSNKALGSFAYIIGLITAILTAFYSWRLIILAFHGNTNASKEVLKKVHESPLIMLIPLFVLAIGAILSGYIGDHVFGMVDSTNSFWRDAIFVTNHNNPLSYIASLSLFEKKVPMLMGLLGILIAFILYKAFPHIAIQISARFKTLHTTLLNKWYVDEAYDYLFVSTSKRIGSFCWRKFDNIIIDGMPNGAAILSRKFAQIISIIQTGFVYHYAIIMMIAILAFLTFAIYHFNLM